ncbi:hypothetical protein AYK26_00735 [Euryarchaeota archaeon SM23-78]|nr:MAG: hypothetical protein AYK26_00735 [Euryarchaeota archaeon SM23-78]
MTIVFIILVGVVVAIVWEFGITGFLILVGLVVAVIWGLVLAGGSAHLTTYQKRIIFNPPQKPEEEEIKTENDTEQKKQAKRKEDSKKKKVVQQEQNNEIKLNLTELIESKRKEWYKLRRKHKVRYISYRRIVQSSELKCICCQHNEFVYCGPYYNCDCEAHFFLCTQCKRSFILDRKQISSIFWERKKKYQLMKEKKQASAEVSEKETISMPNSAPVVVKPKQKPRSKPRRVKQVRMIIEMKRRLFF